MTKGTAYCVLFVGAVVVARLGFELLSHKTREAVVETIAGLLLGGLALTGVLLIVMAIYTLVTQ
jgi:hypothetical protein